MPITSRTIWAPKQRLDSHVSGSFGRPRTLWAVRHYFGHPRNWEPTRTLGHPKPTIIGHPHVIVEVHELLWVAMRYYGRPRDFLSVHAIVLAVHEKLWTLTRDIWASSVYRSALPRVTGGLTRYLHGCARGFVGVHDGISWATIRSIMRIHTFQRAPTMLRAHPSRSPGRPRKI